MGLLVFYSIKILADIRTSHGFATLKSSENDIKADVGPPLNINTICTTFQTFKVLQSKLYLILTVFFQKVGALKGPNFRLYLFAKHACIIWKVSFHRYWKLIWLGVSFQICFLCMVWVASMFDNKGIAPLFPFERLQKDLKLMSTSHITWSKPAYYMNCNCNFPKR